MAIGVAGVVEPLHGHPLAIARTRQQPIHDLLIRIRGRVRQKRLHLGRRRRQARQVERHTTNQCRAIGLGRGFQLFGFQASEDKLIDCVLGPGFVRDRRRFGALWRDPGPVPLILGPFVDPAAERVDLLGAELLVRARRRHHHFFVFARHARDHIALVGAAGHNREDTRVCFLDRGVVLVEAQARLARLVVKAVTLKAVLGQDRPHVAIERQLGRFRGVDRRRERESNTESDDQGKRRRPGHRLLQKRRSFYLTRTQTAAGILLYHRKNLGQRFFLFQDRTTDFQSVEPPANL